MRRMWHGHRGLCRISAALLVGRDEPAWVTEPDWAWECQLPQFSLSSTCLPWCPMFHPFEILTESPTVCLSWDTLGIRSSWVYLPPLSSLGPTANCFSYILINNPPLAFLMYLSGHFPILKAHYYSFSPLRFSQRKFTTRLTPQTTNGCLTNS